MHSEVKNVKELRSRRCPSTKYVQSNQFPSNALKSCNSELQIKKWGFGPTGFAQIVIKPDHDSLSFVPQVPSVKRSESWFFSNSKSTSSTDRSPKAITNQGITLMRRNARGNICRQLIWCSFYSSLGNICLSAQNRSSPVYFYYLLIISIHHGLHVKIGSSLYLILKKKIL